MQDVNGEFINIYIEKLTGQCSELLKANLVLQAQSDLKDRIISTLSETVEKLNQEEAEDTAEVTASGDEIARLTQIIKEKDELIAARNNENVSLTARLADANQKVMIHTNDIRTLENNFTNLSNKYDEDVARLTREISELKKPSIVPPPVTPKTIPVTATTTEVGARKKVAKRSKSVVFQPNDDF